MAHFSQEQLRFAKQYMSDGTAARRSEYSVMSAGQQSAFDELQNRVSDAPTAPAKAAVFKEWKAEHSKPKGSGSSSARAEERAEAHADVAEDRAEAHADVAEDRAEVRAEEPSVRRERKRNGRRSSRSRSSRTGSRRTSRFAGGSCVGTVGC